jgi:tetratricopeptide (TPR) repeat protein
MKRPYLTLFCWVLCLLCATSVVAQKASPAKSGPAKPAAAAKPGADKAPTAEDEAAAKAELKAILDLPAPERVAKLKAFIAAHPRSATKDPATEALVRARAAWGDAKFRDLDVAGGIEQFKLAVADAPANMSDNLFDKFILQMPVSLFVNEQPAAALELGRAIEAKVGDNPLRLLKLALFYLSLENGEAATRAAERAVKLDPNRHEAFMALGSAQRIQLKLDDAAQSYARALELEPTSVTAKRSLADMKRATGHADEALPLYRELLALHPDDEFAETGVVMSLFDTGQKEEAERLLTASLKADPRGLALLTGAAYWYAAHNDGAHAVEYGTRAVELEPRYVWAQVALARGLIASKQPLAAERALRIARNFGNFPTLTYELANALVAAGFYEEAARELASAFALKDGAIETRLAGRITSRGETFTELLAAERRASIFQATAADTAANAEGLKRLFLFNATLSNGSIKDDEAVTAARAFTSGTDEMRAYRQLYAAGRLTRAGIAWGETQRLTESATGGVESALDVPNATAAVMADELLDERARALAQGGSLNIPAVERATLSRILRGRVEDLAGWSLYNQSKPAEAVVRLRRAVNVLPDGSAWWRSSMWHLGAALEASGNSAEALTIYYKTYQSGGPDPVRRVVIESLYRKVNGSLNGLDDKIGPAAAAAQQGVVPASGSTAAPPFSAPLRTTPTESAGTDAVPSPTGSEINTQPAEQPVEKPAAEPTQPVLTLTNPRDVPATTPAPTPVKSPEIAAPDPAPMTPPQPEPTPEATPTPTPEPIAISRPEPPPEIKPTPTPEPPVIAAPLPTPEPTPQIKSMAPPETPAVAFPLPTPEPTPEVKPAPVERRPEPANVEPAQMTVLPMPTESSEPPSTPARSRETAPARRPRVAKAARAESSPEAAYRDLYAAVQGQDFAAIQQLLSRATIDYALDLAKIDHRPFNEVVRSGFTATTAAAGLPETRTVSSSASDAMLEVRDEANGGWERIPFVKQDGQWKLAVGDVKRGLFRDPAGASAPAPEAKAPATDPAPAEPVPATAAKTEPGVCTIKIDDADLSMLSNGGSISLTIGLNGSVEIDKITASTPNWADIAVFPQAGLRADATERVFTVTSISKNTGEFTVVFKTPCGNREVKLTVR